LNKRISSRQTKFLFPQLSFGSQSTSYTPKNALGFINFLTISPDYQIYVSTVTWFKDGVPNRTPQNTSWCQFLFLFWMSSYHFNFESLCLLCFSCSMQPTILG
jgi:hypothetical protein